MVVRLLASPRALHLHPSQFGAATVGQRDIPVPDKLFPSMHEVSDRAGSRSTSPKRCPQCCLRHGINASAPQTKVVSRLNIQPARTPVNASPAPLPSPTHDSGPLWLAKPSTYVSFRHDNSPVSWRTMPNHSLNRTHCGGPSFGLKKPSPNASPPQWAG